MAFIPMSDLGRTFLSTQASTHIRESIARRNQELVTETVTDIPASLGGNHGRWASIMSRLDMIETYQNASKAVASRLEAAQTTLAGIDILRSQMADELMAWQEAIPSQVQSAVEMSRGAFEQTVRLLNTTHAGRSLFAGVETEEVALADGAEILAMLRTHVAGLPPSADPAEAIATWFDDPAGEFSYRAYQGSATAAAQHVDEGHVVAMDVTAEAEVFRTLLKGYALVALLDDPAFEGADKSDLIEKSAQIVFGASDGMIKLHAKVGIRQAELETRQASLPGEKAMLSLEERNMAGVDSAEAATALQAASTQLEMHYTLTSKLSKLTLVNFV